MIAEREPIISKNPAEVARPHIKKTQKVEEIEEKYRQPIGAVLNNYYWGEKRSLRQIGEEFRVDYATLRRWMKRLGIKMRSCSEVTKVFWEDPERKQLVEVRRRQAFGNNPADTLRAWHWEERLTIAEIAQRVDRSRRYVSEVMVKLGVKKRNVYIRRKRLQGLAIGIRNLPASDRFDTFSIQRLRDKGIIDGNDQQRTITTCEKVIAEGRKLAGVTGQDGIGDISLGQFYEYLLRYLQSLTEPNLIKKD